MKKALLCAVVFLTACTNTLVQKDSEDLIVSPNDTREYRTIELPNKLEVVLIHDPSLDQSAAAMSVGVGLLNDPMTQQGMAHFLEHLLFMGTEKYPDPSEHSKFMSKNGGQSNAYTWLDITNYMFKINTDAYDEALDRFSEFFKSPKLYEKYVDKERNAVNAEWSMRRELDFFAQFRLQRELMGEHPANRFLIGNLDTLNDKDNSKLHAETVNFYNKYYSANIMKLVLLSNKPLDELEALTRKSFTAIENKNIQKPKVTTNITKDLGPKLINFVPTKDSKTLLLDFTIKANHQDYLAKPNNYVSYLLGSQMPGTPAYILKQEGLINSLYTVVRQKEFGNYGQFLIQAELTDAGLKKQDYISAMILQYIELIKKEGIDKKYYAEIKASLSNKFTFLSKKDPFSEVSQLAASLQNYPLQHAISHPYTYKTFQDKPIKRLLDQLNSKNLRIWQINKHQEATQDIQYYDGKYEILDVPANDIAQMYQQKIDGLQIPAVNRYMPESFAIKTKPGQTSPIKIIENESSEIWFQPSQYFSQEPKGRFIAQLAQSNTFKDAKTQVVANLWINLFRLKMSALLTEGRVADVNFNIYTDNGLNISISGMTDKQHEYLSEVLENIDIQFNESELNNAVTKYVTDFQNKNKSFAYNQAFDAFRVLVNENLQSNATYIQLAKQVTLSDVNGFIKSLRKKMTMRGFAFGNYEKRDVKRLSKLIADEFKPSADHAAYRPVRYWSPAAQSMTALQTDIDVQDTALVNVIVHPAKGLKSIATAQLLGELMRTEAFQKMRTEEQLAYAVGAFGTRIGNNAGIGLYIQSPVKSPNQAQERFDKFYAEYLGSLEAFNRDDFENIKKSKLTRLKEKPNNIYEELGPILDDWRENKNQFDSTKQLIQATESLTLDDLIAFYKASVSNKDAARLYIQLRGEKFKDTAFPSYQVKTFENINQLKLTLKYDQ